MISGDAEVHRKLAATKLAGKPIDGHAPGPTGQDAIDYAGCGITTDHESASIEEAEPKLRHGMKIQIRGRGRCQELSRALFAGIMTTADGDKVTAEYEQIDRIAKSQLGIKLTAFIMTLSFMALLVIPSLKLSDRGLFDAEAFKFVG